MKCKMMLGTRARFSHLIMKGSPQGMYTPRFRLIARDARYNESENAHDFRAEPSRDTVSEALRWPANNYINAAEAVAVLLLVLAVSWNITNNNNIHPNCLLLLRALS